MNSTDLLDVGLLLQWALRPSVKPAQEQEYAHVLNRYLDEVDFRSAVRQVAAGLGLDIIDSGPFGLLLVPIDEGSIFALHPSAFRGRPLEPDERLLDGLIQIGIAASVYPRPEDMDEEPTMVRPAFSVSDVDAAIRSLCMELADEAKSAPHPSVSDLERGMAEAWRAYDARPAEKEGALRASRKSTLHLIRTSLDRMVEHGLFTRPRGTEDRYQATYAYQMRIQTNAVRTIVGRVRVGAPSSDTEND